MPYHRRVGVTRLATFSPSAGIEQARQAPAGQRAERPIDFRCLRQTRRQAHDIGMLVPYQFGFRAFHVSDAGAPRSAPQMHDGAEERIDPPGRCVDIHVIEQHERGTRMTSGRQRIGGQEQPQLERRARAQRGPMIEQGAHPGRAVVQCRLDIAARGPRTQALESIRRRDAARVEECERRRQLRREQIKVRLGSYGGELTGEVSRIVETAERQRGKCLRDQTGPAEISRRAGCQYPAQRHGSTRHVERRQESRSRAEIGAARSCRLASFALRDSDCGTLRKKTPREPNLEHRVKRD